MKSVFGGHHRKINFPPIFCIYSIENDNGGPVGRGEPGVLVGGAWLSPEALIRQNKSGLISSVVTKLEIYPDF